MTPVLKPIRAAKAATAAAARAEGRQQGDVLLVALTGEWQLEQPTPRFDDVVKASLAEMPGRRTIRTIGFDTSELGAWDSSLLIFLLKATAHCATQDLELDEAALPERINPPSRTGACGSRACCRK